MTSVAELATGLLEGASLADTSVTLSIDGWLLRIRSDSPALLDRLRGYFSHLLCSTNDADGVVEVIALERAALELDAPPFELDLADWSREAGKSGRKDSYADLADGRVLRKVRTGMVFLQSQTVRLAVGPCLANDNQVINFVISQYMNELQHRDWLICHAAGLVGPGGALGLAGFSGGGKSTLMLHLMERPLRFLSNDRLFIQRVGGAVEAAGVPKQPRVNPGTLLNNPRLRSIMPAARQAACEALPAAQLWELEEKYDVPVPELYGPDRTATRAPLAAFLLLNWNRSSPDPTQIRPVDLAARRDLLPAIMKSPGPFYWQVGGDFLRDGMALDEDRYLAVLEGVPVYEASGAVDFALAVATCQRWLGS
ncbi:HprK-related kinase B [Parahaliea maris]|uniref:HprK-related kinase B n=1 Tax=Parahaliea maris TaxID=2716870 RepID=A0A5C9A891_9GAMM|nr:HprK-related kinase B [Parahaliea maris]TXS95777.1 HprK-related kinase B [Parahaliea maris]